MAALAWKPMETPDFFSVGLTTCVNVGVALLSFHVWLNRGWVPYKARIPQLAVFTGVAVLVATTAVTMRYGMWGSSTHDRSQLVGCGTQAWLTWAGGGALVSCAFLRVYRCHSVLVRHNWVMWSVRSQLALLVTPFLLPPTFVLVRTRLVAFDPYTQECEALSAVPESFGIGVMITLAVASIVLARTLHRVARFQAPEEVEAAVATSITLVAAVTFLSIIHVLMEGDRVGRRRAMLLAVVAAGVLLFVPPLFRDFVGFLVDDEQYKRSGDYAFDYQDQTEKTKHLRVLAARFDKLVISPVEDDERLSDVMASFFRDTLARECARDYFKLQACTMHILATYVCEGAPMFVPLSPECRNMTLRCRASSAFIFGRAREDIFERMATAAKTAMSGVIDDRSTVSDSDDCRIAISGDVSRPSSVGSINDLDDVNTSRYSNLSHLLGRLEEGKGEGEGQGSTSRATPSPLSSSTSTSEVHPQFARPTSTRTVSRSPSLESPGNEDSHDLLQSVVQAPQESAQLGKFVPESPPNKTVRSLRDSVKERGFHAKGVYGRGRDSATVSGGELTKAGAGAGIRNVRAEFGLEAKSEASNCESDEEKATKIRDDDGTGDGTAEVAPRGGNSPDVSTTAGTLNPLFGDESGRIVGRQPGGKVRPAATRWDFAAHTRNGSAVNTKNVPKRGFNNGRSGSRRKKRSPGRDDGGRADRVVNRAGGKGSPLTLGFFTISEKDDEYKKDDGEA